MGYDQDMTEVRKALDSMGVNVEKARGGFPVGTTKTRRDGKTYKKQADGSWSRVSTDTGKSNELHITSSQLHAARPRTSESMTKPTGQDIVGENVKDFTKKLSAAGLFKPARTERNMNREARTKLAGEIKQTRASTKEYDESKGNPVDLHSYNQGYLRARKKRGPAIPKVK